ncbi:regulatory protein, luxR family [Streptomyces sp. yr375]|nr:regulatory protein, luxR family [Streptomyces sp. yr375]
MALDHGGDPQARLSLAAALVLHWCVGGFLGEGRRQLERALAAAPEPTPARGRALIAAVRVTLTQGELETAERWLAEAEALGEELADPVLSAQASGFRGTSVYYRGGTEEALRRYEVARADLTASGEGRQATSWLLALACVRAYAGDPRAVETGERVIADLEARGERWARAQALMALGYHAWEGGDRDAAKALVRSALESMRGFDDHTMVARMLELLAWSTASGNNHGWAARLLGAADALWKHEGVGGSAFGPRRFEHHARCRKAAVNVLGMAAFRQALAEGARYDSPGRAIEYALDPAHEFASAAGPGMLTRREREVAALVAQGMSNRQIASTLKLSPRTADRHVQNILRKLGFGSRARIASWWSRTQVPAEQ